MSADLGVIAAVLDKMLPYCPVAVQDEATKLLTKIRLPEGIVKLVRDEEDEDDQGEEMLCCPKCGEPAGEGDSFYEDMGATRRVESQEGKTLSIDGYYKTEGWDECATNPRLCCGACETEYVIPDAIEIDWT